VRRTRSASSTSLADMAPDVSLGRFRLSLEPLFCSHLSHKLYPLVTVGDTSRATWQRSHQFSLMRAKLVVVKGSIYMIFFLSFSYKGNQTVPLSLEKSAPSQKHPKRGGDMKRPSQEGDTSKRAGGASLRPRSRNPIEPPPAWPATCCRTGGGLVRYFRAVFS
jgi:hypothetical protein